MLFNPFSNEPTPVRVLRGPFAGARLFVRPRSSKRKIFGLYEQVLNRWILEKTMQKRWVLDIGANDGYDTYGFAHLMKKRGIMHPCVVAFEPQLTSLPELTVPSNWPSYKNCRFVFEDKYVGNFNDGTHRTLDQVMSEYSNELQGPGLIKMDIEGAECEALAGAESLLGQPRVDWLVEIHGKQLVTRVAAFFVNQDRPFLVKEPTPLPVFGAEQRTLETFWLLTL